jgi:hypothetical protein
MCLFSSATAGGILRPESASDPTMPSILDKKIDAWWHEFAARSNDFDGLFSRRQHFDLPAWMQQHLQGIRPELMWEFGPAVSQPGHRLVITPESHRGLRPLVNKMLERAPRLVGWEFYAYRLAESYEMAEQMVQARTGGSISGLSFRATVNDINKVDLVFCAPAYGPTTSNDALVATETLLGEEILDRWIGGIEAQPTDSEEFSTSDIEQLKPTVDRLIASISEKLPNEPYFKLPEANWTLYKLKPCAADDYPRQLDMFVGRTMIVPMWQNAHRNQSFDSVRFSKLGEVFGYVKIHGREGLGDGGFRDNAEIEDAVDGALRSASFGCCVGGGTGLLYSYVDVVLTNVQRGVEIVKRILRDGKIPKRSWIQFFDSDLQDEWIGIWDDTPAPPGLQSSHDEKGRTIGRRKLL